MIPWLTVQVPLVILFHYGFPFVLALPSPYPLLVIAGVVVLHSGITYAAAEEESREPSDVVRITLVIAGLNALLLVITGSEPAFAILIPGTVFYVVLACVWSNTQA